MRKFSSVVVLGLLSYVCSIFPADILFSHQISTATVSGTPHRVKLALKDFTTRSRSSCCQIQQSFEIRTRGETGICTRSEYKKLKREIIDLFHDRNTMTGSAVQGQSQRPAEPKPTPRTHSSSSTRAAQPAAIARWLSEKPTQEQWNQLARMSGRGKARTVSKV